MSIIRYSPVQTLKLFSDLNYMDDFINSITQIDREFKSNLALDITEDEKSYNIRADVPGFEKEDVKISIEKNILTIEGTQKIENNEENKNYIKRERKSLNFKKSIQVYDNVNIEKAKATVKNGVLDILLPKKEEEKSTKTITIE